MGGRTVADALGLVDLASSKLVVPRPTGVDGTLAGTAFDFRARIELGDFNARSSAAAVGALLAGEYSDRVKNGEHRVTVLQDAFTLAVSLLGSGMALDLDRASVLLAHCERVVRSGASALSGSTGDLLDAASNGADFAAAIGNASLQDVSTLLGVNRDQVEGWKREISQGFAYEGNPTFSGSSLVGGADADWIVGETLVECKAYSRLDVSSLREHLLQLLGYVMLDADDLFAIRRVGIWLTRQNRFATWSLSRLLGGDAEELLPALRAEFVKATGNTHLAPSEPISPRRKHQLLADNRHTPYERLAELALSADADIRRRVGRNAVSPEATVRHLAVDRAWSVREGVAMNEAAPDDVLLTLSTDRSKAVRLAVAANPGVPGAAVSALCADADADVRWSARSNDGDTSLAHGGSALAIAGSAVSASSDVVPISGGRDQSAWDSKFVWELAQVMFGASRFGSRLPIPEATSFWAYMLRRDIDVPEWLRAGLPRRVADDFYATSRPAQFRWLAAKSLPIDDPSVRSALLADEEPDIRWDALCRSIGIEADDLSHLLAELGASRSARVTFRRGAADTYSFLTPRESDAEVLGLLATHRSTPGSVLADLSNSTAHGIRLSLLANSAVTSRDRPRIMHAIMSSKSAEHRADLARVWELPGDVLALLAKDTAAIVRRTVAERSDLTADLVDILTADKDWDVRLALIENPDITMPISPQSVDAIIRDASDAELTAAIDAVEQLPQCDEFDEAISVALDRLAKSRARNPDLRQISARHPLTRPGTLRRLATSVDDELRRAVADNSNTPQDALTTLAKDDDVNVRSAVATNPAASRTIVADLAYDTEPDVRAAASRRPDLDLEVLARLLQDDHDGVRRSAWRHPAAQEAAGRHNTSDPEIVDALVPQPRPEPTSREEYEEQAGHPRAEVRMRVAYDVETPVDIPEFLGGERRSARVRRAVAGHPHSPARLLAILADDSDEQVRQAVAFNGSTPPALLMDLAARSVDLAILVALNPDTPDDLLAVLAADTEPIVQHIAIGVRLTRQATERGGDGTSLARLDRRESPN
jgi:hypothetical protein